MSKIRKALDELRNSVGDEQFVEPPTRPTNHQNTGAIDRRTVGAPEVAPHGDTGEVRANRHIEVDLRTVAEFGLAPRAEDQSLISNQFRRVKRPLLQCAFDSEFSVGQNANVIMVASALPGAGKSFCAFNLAQSVALERDVGSVLVDADVLKASVSQSVGLHEHVGLIDYLIDSSLTLSDILVSTSMSDILLIPAGRRHPEATELLASRRMQELVGTLSKRFSSRAVIFDTPPLLITNEARVLSEHMGQIVFVVEARESTQEAALRALSYLDRDKPINAILNKSRSATESGYNSDDYGYYSYPGGTGDGASN